MTYLSVVEKFKILFDTMMGFDYILIFMGMMLVITFIFLIRKMSTKIYLLLLIVMFAFVFGTSIINNYEVLANTFDNFMTIFFSNIYFPSIYVYISVLVISFISFVVSMFNVMLKKIYKVINGIMFVFNNILFVVVLNIIAKNRIDIFSINSLYTDTSLVAVLELSMGLFILWLLSLVVAYTTNCVCDRIANKKIIKENAEEEIFNPVLEVNNDIISDVNLLDDKTYSPVFEVDNNIVINNIVNDEVVLDDNVIVENINNQEESIIEQVDNNTDISNIDEVIVPSCDSNITLNDILRNNNLITYYAEEDNDSFKEEQLLTEESKVNEKDMLCRDRTSINTVSLNDLIDEDDIITDVETSNNVNVLKIEDVFSSNNDYTIDDYKKLISMLNEIKNCSSSGNITIDDAVALSLINNYSLDDCMKFKNILESNLN